MLFRSMTAFQARIPRLSMYRGRGALNELLPFLKSTQWLVYGVFLIGYTVLLFLGQDILNYISSNVLIGNFGLVALFSFATFFSRWGAMSLSISNQANHVVEHINAIVVGSVFLIVSIIFYPYMGVAVFPFAILCGLIVSSPLLISQVYPTLNCGFWTYEKSVMIPALMILVLLNLIYYMVFI